jgi:hypothetical protein
MDLRDAMMTGYPPARASSTGIGMSGIATSVGVRHIP